MSYTHAPGADKNFGMRLTDVEARNAYDGMACKRHKTMSTSTKLLLAALLVGFAIHDAHADKKTVCGITVNSSDELQTFRRSLPADKFQFVELVERGRPDWLASACQQGIRCDVLLISGHYDGRNEFYSQQVDVEEFLPVDELERVSCSASCPGLFSQLKEVYLFGCNTLNPETAHSASTEIVRTLSSAGGAERMSHLAGERHAESNRDRMRSIFKGVPVIYGFSAKAPVGATAASMLYRHFQADGIGDVGSGRVSSKLLGRFAANSMTVASGMTDADPRAAERRQYCQFSDDRLSAAQKLDFVHQLLNRDMADVRVFLDRIEKHTASLTAAQRQVADVAAALGSISSDQSTRSRYLEFVRRADPPAIRARLIKLAGSLGWLSPAEERSELMRMVGDLLARDSVSPADAELVCTLNQDRSLDPDLPQLNLSASQTSKLSQATVLACLGSAEGRARMLAAATSPNPSDVRLAQIYLRHRPIADPDELRDVTTSITRMRGSEAQVLALEALSAHHLTDPDSLDALTRLFAATDSASVQAAVAGVLIRSDYTAVDSPQLAQLLRQHRLKMVGSDLIDVLIRHLERRS